MNHEFVPRLVGVIAGVRGCCTRIITLGERSRRPRSRTSSSSSPTTWAGATWAATATPHQTPNLDAFAKQGVRLTQCYSASAVCSPSRSAILTGRTPHRNGVFTWIAAGSEVHLRTSEITLPSCSRRRGYAPATSASGTSTASSTTPTQPQPNDHGYDCWLATQNNAGAQPQEPDQLRPQRQAGRPARRLLAPPLVVDEAIAG